MSEEAAFLLLAWNTFHNKIMILKNRRISFSTFTWKQIKSCIKPNGRLDKKTFKENCSYIFFLFGLLALLHISFLFGSCRLAWNFMIVITFYYAVDKNDDSLVSFPMKITKITKQKRQFQNNSLLCG